MICYFLELYPAFCDATDLKWNKLYFPNEKYQPTKNIETATAWEQKLKN